MIWLLVNAVLLASVFATLRKRTPERGTFFFLVGLLFYLLILESIAFLLGVAGLLYHETLVGAALCIGGALFLTSWLNKKSPPAPLHIIERFKGLTWSEITLIVVLLIALAGHIAQAVAYPPVGADSLGYHIVSPLWWLQSHAFTPHYFNTSGGEFNYKVIDGYPKSLEILSFWSLALLRDLNLSNAYNPIIVIVLLLSVDDLLVSFGAQRRSLRLFLSLCILTIPLVVLHSASLYNDVGVTAFLTTTICLAVRLIRFPTNGLYWILFFISGGVLAGTKFTGLVFFVIILVFLIAGILIGARNGNTGLKISPRWKLVAAVIAVFLLSGGGWYVWNLSVYKSPYYPLYTYNSETNWFDKNVEMPDTLYGPEFAEHPLRSIITGQIESDAFVTLDSPRSGLGALSFIIGLPSLAIAVFLAARRKNALLAFVLLCFAACFMLQPFRYYPRYILYVSIACILCFGIVLEEVRSVWIRRFLIGLAGALMVYQVVVTIPYTTGRYLLPENIQAAATDGGFDFLKGSHSFNYTGHQFAADPKLIPDGSRLLIYDHISFAAMQRRNLGLHFSLIDKQGADELSRTIESDDTQYVVFAGPAIDIFRDTLNHCLTNPKKFKPVFVRFVPAEFYHWPRGPLNTFIFKVQPIKRQ